MTIEEMTAELGGIFPYFFKDQVKAEARFALYRRALGHLKPEQLEQAYGETMRAWSDDKPPMPKDILSNVRAAKFSAAGDFNFKRMNDALPGIIVEIKASWWRVNGGWADRLVEDFQKANPGHDEIVADEIRMRIRDTINTRSHTFAQLVYRGRAVAPDFRLEEQDIVGSIGRVGPLDPYVIAIREGREPARLAVRRIMPRKRDAA